MLRIRNSALLTGAILVSQAVTAVHAEPTSEPPPSLSAPEDDANQKKLEQRAQQVMNGGSIGAPTYGTLASAILVSTDADDTNATVSLNFKRSHPVGEGRRKDGSSAIHYNYASDSFSIAASAPLGKSGKPSLFDFDKLGDGTSLKFGFARYSGSYLYRPSSDPESNITRTNGLLNKCIDVGSGLWVSKQPDKAAALKIALSLREKVDSIVTSNPKTGYGAALYELSKSEDKDLPPLVNFLGQQCASWPGDDHSGGEVLSALLQEGETLERDEGIKGLWFFGGSGTIARTDYGYLLQSPLIKSDVSKTNYKVTAYGGWILPSGKASLTASFTYVRTFDPGDDVQLCEPNGVGLQIACLTAPLGAPTPIKRYVLAGEGRYLWKLGKSDGAAVIGLAPRASYEWKSKAFLFELPIFLAPDKDGKHLNGGIRFAYDTGENDFGFGLFVGVPFSVFSD